MKSVRRVAVPAYQTYRRATAPRNGRPLLVNSMAKSGTHLLSSQLSRTPGVAFSGVAVVHDHFAKGPRGPVGDMPDYDDRQLRRSLGRCPRSMFAMSHLYWDEATELILDEFGFATVQVVRDPRDILVSLLHYIRNYPEHPSHRELVKQFPTWDDQLVAATEGFPPSSFGRGWAPFSRRIELYLPWTERVPTVRYEAFVDVDPEVRRTEQTRLLHGLGLEGTEIALASMTAGIGDKWSATFRQGTSGGWRSSFTDHSYERFLTVAGEATRLLGYSVE